VLKKAFDAFDREKSGSISTNMVEEILRLMGQPFNRNTLEELIDEVDADSKYSQHEYGPWDKMHGIPHKANRETLEQTAVKAICNDTLPMEYPDNPSLYE
jgi:Ca2+-binding EF-hand superfamily protein